METNTSTISSACLNKASLEQTICGECGQPILFDRRYQSKPRYHKGHCAAVAFAKRLNHKRTIRKERRTK